MKKVVLGSLFISSLFMLGSCNNDKTEEGNIENVENSAEYVYELEGVFPKNDRFQIFYSNDTNFTEDKSVTVIVYGQTTLQKVIFKIPNGEKPQNLRLDFGGNAEQNAISIKSFKANYKGSEFEIFDEKFREYFPDTNSVVFDPVKIQYNLVANVDGVFDPLIYSGPKLKMELNKLYNNTKETK